jgi:hypothetical protein
MRSGGNSTTAEIVHAVATHHEVTPLAVALEARRPTRYERFVKPIIDRLAAALLTIVLSPGDVRANQPIAYADVELPEGRLGDKLRAEQHGRRTDQHSILER